MGTYIAYVFVKEICLCAVWLAAIRAVFAARYFQDSLIIYVKTKFQ